MSDSFIIVGYEQSGVARAGIGSLYPRRPQREGFGLRRLGRHRLQQNGTPSPFAGCSIA